MATESDPEFGHLVHEERVRTPLMYGFGVGVLLMFGIAVGVAFFAVAGGPRPPRGGEWLFFGVVEALVIGFGLLFAFQMWREYRTRYGVRWQVYKEGIAWSQGSVVRRLAFRDVKQIGVTQRVVATANSGIPTSGYLAIRLADEVDAADPIELVVRFDALPNSPVTGALMGIRDDLETQVAERMHVELHRGRARWTGGFELTAKGVLHPDGRGERLVPWGQIRRLVLDAQREELRLPEHGMKGCRVRVPTTGPNFYPGLGLVVEKTGLAIERPALE